LEKALDLSFDRLLMMMMKMIRHLFIKHLKDRMVFKECLDSDLTNIQTKAHY